MIEVYNNGEKVFHGPVDEFLSDNQNDELVLEKCSELEKTDTVIFEEFSGRWVIKKILTYKEETLKYAQGYADSLGEDFIREVNRLLKTGAVDPEFHSRGLLFGVALENLADGYLRGSRGREYKNLKKF